MWFKSKTDVLLLGIKTEARYEYDGGDEEIAPDAWVNEVLINGQWVDAVDLLSAEVLDDLNGQVRAACHIGEDLTDYEAMAADRDYFRQAA